MPFDGPMAFVPEEQAERSLARSAWGWRPSKEPFRRVRYDRAQLIPQCILGIISILLSDTAFEFSSLQSSNRSAHPRNHTVAYGTAILGWRYPRHFAPGYDRAVPLGRNTFRAEALIKLALMGL